MHFKVMKNKEPRELKSVKVLVKKKTKTPKGRKLTTDVTKNLVKKRNKKHFKKAVYGNEC